MFLLILKHPRINLFLASYCDGSLFLKMFL